jgi:hypothetical protein
VPNLFIAEYAEASATFRWRLAGTAVCELFGRELTGTNMLADWDGFETEVIARHLHITLSALQPCLLRFRLRLDQDEVIGAELAGFPAVSADGKTPHIFGGVFAFREPSGPGRSAITRLELSAARTIWTEHLNSELAPERPAIQTFRQFHVIPGGRSS